MPADPKEDTCSDSCCSEPRPSSEDSCSEGTGPPAADFGALWEGVLNPLDDDGEAVAPYLEDDLRTLRAEFDRRGAERDEARKWGESLTTWGKGIQAEVERLRGEMVRLGRNADDDIGHLEAELTRLRAENAELKGRGPLFDRMAARTIERQERIIEELENADGCKGGDACGIAATAIQQRDAARDERAEAVEWGKRERRRADEQQTRAERIRESSRELLGTIGESCHQLEATNVLLRDVVEAAKARNLRCTNNREKCWEMYPCTECRPLCAALAALKEADR
jgi:chromosome segregation ATPase